MGSIGNLDDSFSIYKDSSRIPLPIQASSSSESSDLSSGAGDSISTAPDFSDACIKYLTDILMEENLDDNPTTIQDYMALQATEKSLYDAIGKSYSLPPAHQYVPDWIQQALFTDSGVSAVRKVHQRDASDDDESVRSSKHFLAYVEDDLQTDQYDDVLLASCEGGTASCWDDRKLSPLKEQTANAKSSKGKKIRGRKNKKQISNSDMLDLNPLLTQCAQSVAAFDFNGANELLNKIRKHSSPFGDGTQRAAHYFADGLEARLAGTASHLYSDYINWQISASSFIKAYRFYVSAVPYLRTTFFLANKTIKKLCANATRVHIIDFGIFCGIQWPCLIQALSERPNGPPVLRITAVEFPEKGYKPAARLEETGRRLAGYCKRFGVPFEYHPIAQRWDALQPENFAIQPDEVVVVNCLYRGRALLGDTAEIDSPRDTFLKLIKNLNPNLFIHGIVNGTYNAPFFTTRFKEALFHFSAIFDLFEATMPREVEERRWIERGLYGREILNVVACEGAEGVDRPETYKQWDVRNRRAGLRQVALDREILGRATAMVRANYHKDFVVDEVSNWMLQGWKGRLLYALSCWKPA